MVLHSGVAIAIALLFMTGEAGAQSQRNYPYSGPPSDPTETFYPAQQSLPSGASPRVRRSDEDNRAPPRYRRQSYPGPDYFEPYAPSTQSRAREERGSPRDATISRPYEPDLLPRRAGRPREESLASPDASLSRSPDPGTPPGRPDRAREEGSPGPDSAAARPGDHNPFSNFFRRGFLTPRASTQAAERPAIQPPPAAAPRAETGEPQVEWAEARPPDARLQQVPPADIRPREDIDTSAAAPTGPSSGDHAGEIAARPVERAPLPAPSSGEAPPRNDSWIGPFRLGAAPPGAPAAPAAPEARPPANVAPNQNDIFASLPPEDRPELGEPQELPPQLKRQLVDYATKEPAGTIVIDTPNTFLYLVLGNGKALRYGVGVGREGFTWSGRERISRMSEWPDWYPPADMIERQPYLPRMMAGGLGNPLGARALYLGKTLYRIHGTNQPSTIGKFVSSGCIRLLNEDVIDLYGRVQIGTRVVVLPADPPMSASVATPPAANVSASQPLVITNKPADDTAAQPALSAAPAQR